MVQILVSPPASGKTYTCIQIIQDTLAGQPLAPVWVIARDHRQAGAFRRTLARAGGSLGLRIATFSDLCIEILDETNNRLPAIPDALSHRLIQTAIARSDLAYYGQLRGLPGFTLMVESAINEFKRALVTPAMLVQSTPSEQVAIHELAQIYQTYESLLEQIQWTDREGYAQLAIETLEREHSLFTNWALLVVDGLDGFTPAQRRLLQLLANRPKKTLITLPGDLIWNRPVQSGFQSALADLQKDLATEIITLKSPVKQPKALAYLEANLFETGNAPFGDKTKQVNLFEVRSPAEEAREALRFIKARVVRESTPIQECAILVPDTDLYFQHLRAAAIEFGMPIHFSQSRQVVRAPAIAALLNLLSLSLQNFPRRRVIDALRSPFFDLSGSGLTPGKVDVIDLISRYGVVIEGLDQWQESFKRLEGRSAAQNSGPVDDSEEASAPDLPVGPAARVLQMAFEAWIDQILPPAEPQTVRQWVTWLEDRLDWLHFCESIEKTPNQDHPALSTLCNCLRGMILSDALLGERTVDFASFVAEFQGILQGSGYREDSDPHQDAISILRPIEARGLRFQSVVVMGLSEGIFPDVEHPDPLLDETTRSRLGLQPRLERNQAGLFYQAITRPDSVLLLTRPYLSDTGDPWEPSPYWNAVLSLFPNQVRRIRPEDPRALAQAASAEEAIFWAVRRESLNGANLSEESFIGLRPRFAQVSRARVRLSQLLENTDEAPQTVELAGWIEDHTGPGSNWSTSRLESFSACSYRFFIETVLAVEAHDPPEWDFNAAQLGSMLHAILERAYRETTDPANLSDLLEKLREAARQEFSAAPVKYSFRPTPLWVSQCAELLERLEQTVVSISNQSIGWRPFRFEQHFGDKGQPALRITAGNQSILLRGVIDRVDINDRGELRVIDYKTGGNHLAVRDLIDGRRLQLGVYALAVQEACRLGDTVEGFYWKIGKDGDSSLKLSRFQSESFNGPGGAIQVTLNHIGLILDGMSAGRFNTQPLDGKCPSYCPAAAWCWRYTPE